MAANVVAGSACHASAAAIVQNPAVGREFPVRAVALALQSPVYFYFVSIITAFVLSSLK